MVRRETPRARGYRAREGVPRAHDPPATVTARPFPKRHWRSYGSDPLPTGAEALDEPFNAFPSWFLGIECDRCGKVQMVNQAHMSRSDMPMVSALTKQGKRPPVPPLMYFLAGPTAAPAPAPACPDHPRGARSSPTGGAVLVAA